MLRQERQQELNNLCDKIADALGVSAGEIHNSERFEQSIYDMAKVDAKIADLAVSGKAHFGIDHNTNRIVITYDVSVAHTKELAFFYQKNFPETKPEYTYGMKQAISFLKEPFIQKVLPALKSWRTRPSAIADSHIHYVDSSEMLLKSPLRPAVFITGADPLLGEWKTAFRLKLNKVTQDWEFEFPEGLKNNEFKYLTGNFDLGEKVSSDKLTYEPGPNRTLVVLAPAAVNNADREISYESKPTGYGVRC
jgi:hypothetical protein